MSKATTLTLILALMLISALGSTKADEPFKFLYSTCSQAAKNFNKGIAQLTDKIKNQASKWVIYSGLDALDDVSYYLKYSCAKKNYVLANQQYAGQTQVQYHACSALHTILKSVFDQNEAHNFKGAKEGGVALSLKALDLSKNLGEGCRIQLLDDVTYPDDTHIYGEATIDYEWNTETYEGSGSYSGEEVETNSEVDVVYGEGGEGDNGWNPGFINDDDDSDDWKVEINEEEELGEDDSEESSEEDSDEEDSDEEGSDDANVNINVNILNNEEWNPGFIVDNNEDNDWHPGFIVDNNEGEWSPGFIVDNNEGDWHPGFIVDNNEGEWNPGFIVDNNEDDWHPGFIVDDNEEWNALISDNGDSHVIQAEEENWNDIFVLDEKNDVSNFLDRDLQADPEKDRFVSMINEFYGLKRQVKPKSEEMNNFEEKKNFISLVSDFYAGNQGSSVSGPQWRTVGKQLYFNGNQGNTLEILNE